MQYWLNAEPTQNLATDEKELQSSTFSFSRGTIS